MAKAEEIKMRREYLRQIASYALFDEELSRYCLELPEGVMDQVYDDLIMLPDNILNYRVRTDSHGLS